jgi:hypothetical protein
MAPNTSGVKSLDHDRIMGMQDGERERTRGREKSEMNTLKLPWEKNERKAESDPSNRPPTPRLRHLE